MNSSAYARLGFGLVFIFALGGCQRVHVGTDDAGPGGSDAGARDAGNMREQCGPTLCEVGQVCCNASCGICTAPGLACPSIACTTDCASNADCAPTEYCALARCPDGVPDGTCLPRPEACPDNIEPICGCDGVAYTNACEGQRAGTVAGPRSECGSCAAMDARGDGDCAAILGVVWNGVQCTMIGGCSCVGADCGDVYASVTECEGARLCHSCEAQDAVGEGFCDAVVGVFWDGNACVTQSGCSCVGADCDRGWATPTDCEIAHRHCGPTPTCTSSADCAPGEWCVTPRGECGGVGTCEGTPPPGWSCPDPGPPVCGCDGVTYGCDEHAHSLGANVAGDGACSAPCAAMDATGSGACLLALGFVWDGTACVGIGGCECVGRDCGDVTTDEAACLAAHAGCERPPGAICGGLAGGVCRPDEFCDYPDGSFCGGADETGVCTTRPMACTFEVVPVCGCDGATHDNACFANMAGVDVASMGTCASP